MCPIFKANTFDYIRTFELIFICFKRYIYSVAFSSIETNIRNKWILLKQEHIIAVYNQIYILHIPPVFDPLKK